MILYKKIYSFIIIVFLLNGCGNKKENEISNATVEVTQSVKTNVIVILLDDAGYNDFGFMGSKDIETPNIDSLVRDGVIFSDAHVTASVCAPSRAGIITGKYQQQFGFESNHTGDEESGEIGLPDQVTTLAEVFQQNDYKTIAIGKWHLGYLPSDHPNNRGFDEFYGFLSGGRSYFPLKTPNKNNMLQQNGKKIEFKGYLTDILGNRSVNFVEENKNKPFFMYLAYNAVHTPMEAKQEDIEKFKNHPRQLLAAMTWSLDQNIGKLTHKLKTLGLYENTLIFFLNDNGGAANNNSSNLPLKGWKGNEFEGGHRVPFAISWPAKLPKNKQFNGLTSSLDIFKTAISAAQLETKENLDLDGVNLIPFLLSDNKNAQPHQKLYWRKLEESAARMGQYKLVQLENYGAVLYDLSTDIGEQYDLSSEKSEIFNNIKKDYKEWNETLINPLWREGKEWEDITYYIQQRLMQNKEVEYTSPKSTDK